MLPYSIHLDLVINKASALFLVFTWSDERHLRVIPCLSCISGSQPTFPHSNTTYFSSLKYDCNTACPNFLWNKPGPYSPLSKPIKPICDAHVSLSLSCLYLVFYLAHVSFKYDCNTSTACPNFLWNRLGPYSLFSKPIKPICDAHVSLSLSCLCLVFYFAHVSFSILLIPPYLFNVNGIWFVGWCIILFPSWHFNCMPKFPLEPARGPTHPSTSLSVMLMSHCLYLAHVSFSILLMPLQCTPNDILLLVASWHSFILTLHVAALMSRFLSCSCLFNAHIMTLFYWSRHDILLYWHLMWPWALLKRYYFACLFIIWLWR